MKIKFTDLFNNYQDDTINFKCKDIVDSKKILQRTGIVHKNHITMTKKAISWSIGIAVAMMSCITVYAVESGSLDKFIDNALKYRTTPYSYSGSYNEVIDYDTFFAQNINTNIEAENITCNNPDVNIEVEGVLCDINSVEIVANLTIPNANLIDKNDVSYRNVYFQEYHINSKCDKSVNKNDLYINFLEDDNTTDNIIPIEINFTLDDMKSAEGEYNIQISNLTKREFIENHFVKDDVNGNNNYISIADFDLSFDLNIQDCDVSTKIDNINKTISTPIGNVEIDSINYSPMSFCINFKEPLQTDLSEYISNFNGNRHGYSYSSNEDFSLNEFSKVENYINMYFIYSNGEKVFASRNTKMPIFENDTMGMTNMIYDYYHSGLDMIDYTNIVSVEINGVVIPLTK